MEKVFYIKNMVCDRCKTSVKEIVLQNNAEIIDLQLGRIVIKTSANFNLAQFADDLSQNGFELMKDPDLQLTESIKINLIEWVKEGDNGKISTFLAEKLNKDYSILSKTFKKTEGETIEKYLIKLKIEKAKELIQMQKLTFSEIAYQLGYRSISHLSGQFKSVTGMTMSEYKETRDWNRQSLDQII